MKRQNRTLLDARGTVRAVCADLAAGVHVGIVAARFHDGLARATADACAALAQRRGTQTVVVSGGSFQNRRLLERTTRALADGGLRVLTPERLPPGDGGISFGQAAVAAARVAALPHPARARDSSRVGVRSRSVRLPAVARRRHAALALQRASPDEMRRALPDPRATGRRGVR